MSETYKHKITTDALDTLGTVIGPNERRDAIHLAVEPVEAGQRLQPGRHVVLRGGKAYAADDVGTDAVGIVDPFLTAWVDKGQRFWLVVYPRVITSLRHVWTHPGIPSTEAASSEMEIVQLRARQESKNWLIEYADKLFGGYGNSDGDESDLEVLMRCAEEGYFGTEIEGPGRNPDDLFWMHFERYAGRPAKSRPDWFRCGC